MRTVYAHELRPGDMIIKPNGDRQEVDFVGVLNSHGDIIADTFDLVGEFLIVERFLSDDLVNVV